MTFIAGLPDSIKKLLRDLVTGAVDAAARDSEAWSHGNGIDDSSSYDIGMRNGVAHAHKSAILESILGEYGLEILAEILGDIKEVLDPTPNNAQDSWKDQYNNEVGRRMASWMEDNDYTKNHINPETGKNYTDKELENILDDLIKDAVDNDEIIGDPVQDSRTNGTDSPLNSDNVPVDAITGEELDPKEMPTWTEPSEDWVGSSNERNYSHPNVQFPDVFNEPIKAIGYSLSEALQMAGSLYDSGTDAVAAIYVGLNFLASEAQKFFEGLFNDLGEWIADGLKDLWEWIQTFGSPLVLDLDGDGIELSSMANANVYWDIDEDGFGEQTGWVTGDDGFLAIDLNSDGIVTDHTELFGSTTQDGFSALAVYDTNSDNVIDANDAQFDDLIVWIDANADGISEESEIYTLADLDIISINLNASTPYNYFIEGNHITHVSSFTVDDGVSGAQTFDIVDVWFEYNNLNTSYVADYTLDLAALFVTTVRGYGDIPDMHIAASLDNDTSDSDSLMSLLQEFKAISFEDMFANSQSTLDKVTTIMFRWAGVDGVDPASRGGDVDARELVFLEKLMGEAYLQGGSVSTLFCWVQMVCAWFLIWR